MSVYGGINKACIDSLFMDEINECGTSCCLLGLAPEILEVHKHHFENNCFKYGLFSMDHFPYLHMSGSIRRPLWGYLFDADWPNDLDHALERIQDVLDEKVTDLMTMEGLYNEMRKYWD